MTPQARARAQRLEAILAHRDAHDRRILADLHLAGFKFQTLERAYRRLKANRTAQSKLKEF